MVDRSSSKWVLELQLKFFSQLSSPQAQLQRKSGQCLKNFDSSSCIDPFLVNQPNLVIDSDIYPSLPQNCHPQVIFYKLNLKIQYRLLYARNVWVYGKAQTDLINHAIDQFDWVNLILDNNINEQALFFSSDGCIGVISCMYWKSKKMQMCTYTILLMQ